MDADPQTGRVIWNRSAYHAIVQAGLLENGRYELLEGEIVKIMPNEPHTFVNSELVFLLANIFGSAYVRVPSSLWVSEASEPEPDVSVTVKPRREYLETGIPPGSESRLVVEVSDGTLWRDKGHKAKLYATAGVPEYWVVNLTGRTVIVHRRPVGEDYQSIVTYNENESRSRPRACHHLCGDFPAPHRRNRIKSVQTRHGVNAMPPFGKTKPVPG